MSSSAPPVRSTDTPPASAAPRAGIVFVVTALGTFMASLDLSIVNVAFPDIEASYPAASSASLSWIITAYSIVFGALLVVGGRTGDRLGRKRVFEGGIVVFLLGSFLCGIAPNVGMLVAARALQGIGAAFLVPASVALLIAAYPPERRMQIVAQWGGIGALAVATGPSLGAAIVSAGGWRWAFFVNLPVGLFVLIAGRKVLTESPRDDTAGTPDYLGVVLMSLSLAALVLAVSEGSTWGWADARILAALAVALVGGAVFVHRTRHHDNPVIDPVLFESRSFVLANSATVVYAAGFFAMLLGNILFLTGVWDYSIMRAGLAVTPGPIVVAIIAGPAGKLAARIGFRPVLLFGATSFALGLLSYVLRVEATPNYLGSWLPGTLLVGVGIGFTFPVLSAGAVSSLPPARFAVGSAVNQTARQIGGALGIAVLVALIGSQRQLANPLDGFEQLWMFAAATSVISGVIGSFIPRPTPAQAIEVQELSEELLAVEADALPLDVERA
ncbi:MAG: DHA2 family efflux MFS transporter permease subunit [Ilumatobacteraceae bacterium]